jgi:hypothetical protein
MKVKIDYDSARENRNFGLVMAVALPVLGFVQQAFHYLFGFGDGRFGVPHWGFFALGAVFLLPALTIPKVLKPIFWLWMQLAFAINFVVTHVLLTIVFLLMLAPMRLLHSLGGKDPLKRAWDPTAESYWDEPEDQPEEFKRYKDQF